MRELQNENTDAGRAGSPGNGRAAPHQWEAAAGAGLSALSAGVLAEASRGCRAGNEIWGLAEPAGAQAGVPCRALGARLGFPPGASEPTCQCERLSPAPHAPRGRWTRQCAERCAVCRAWQKSARRSNPLIKVKSTF